MEVEVEVVASGKRTLNETPKEVQLENERQDQAFRFAEFDVDDAQWFATVTVCDETGEQCGAYYRHRYTGRPMLIVLQAGSHYTLYFQAAAEFGTTAVGMTTVVAEAREAMPQQLQEVVRLYDESLGPVFGESDATDDAEELHFRALVEQWASIPQQATERRIVKARRSDADSK